MQRGVVWCNFEHGLPVELPGGTVPAQIRPRLSFLEVAMNANAQRCIDKAREEVKKHAKGEEDEKKIVAVCDVLLNVASAFLEQMEANARTRS